MWRKFIGEFSEHFHNHLFECLDPLRLKPHQLHTVSVVTDRIFSNPRPPHFISRELYGNNLYSYIQWSYWNPMNKHTYNAGMYWESTTQTPLFFTTFMDNSREDAVGIIINPDNPINPNGNHQQLIFQGYKKEFVSFNNGFSISAKMPDKSTYTSHFIYLGEINFSGLEKDFHFWGQTNNRNKPKGNSPEKIRLPDRSFIPGSIGVI
jgi:hypothetical protein